MVVMSKAFQHRLADCQAVKTTRLGEDAKDREFDKRVVLG